MAAPRHSLTRGTGPLIADPTALAAVEAKNALLQFDEVRRLIPSRMGNLSLTPDDVRGLQWQAIQGIYAEAGKFRQIPIFIRNTPHSPPDPDDVPSHVADMCQYANSHQTDAIHVASYLMWVKRRSDIRRVKLKRSIWLVHILSSSGVPNIGSFSVLIIAAGL
jgi:hypothetical protein